MTNSHTVEWDMVRAIEDLQGLLARIDGRRKVIRTQAWYEGSFDAIFDEVEAMRHEIAAMRGALGAMWAERIEEAREDERGEVL